VLVSPARPKEDNSGPRRLIPVALKRYLLKSMVKLVVIVDDVLAVNVVVVVLVCELSSSYLQNTFHGDLAMDACITIGGGKD